MDPVRPRRLLTVLAFIAFISLGLPDGILGVAWPSIMRDFRVPLSRLGLLLISGATGYLISSFFSARAQQRLGVGGVLLASNVLVLVSLLGNATAPAFWLMAIFGLCGGLGAGAIDAAINAFAAHAFPPRWVTWLHACWGVGATLGPMIMTSVIVSGISWRWGYASVGASIAVMSILFLVTVSLWNAPGGDAQPHHEPHPGIFETLFRPIVLMHVLLFFIYTGIEVTAGQWLFSLLTESRHLGIAAAGATASSYWAALTAGRIGFGFAAEHVRRRTLLRIATIGAPLGAWLIWSNASAMASLLGAVLLGVSLAPIYPLMISATPSRVGKRFATQTIGFEVSAATVGVAALPSLAGVLARIFGLEVVGPFLLIATICLLALHELTLALADRDAA